MTERRVLFIGQKPVGEAAWERLRRAERDDFRVVAVCSNASASRVWWKSNAVYKTRGDARFLDNERRNPEELRAAIEEFGVNLILVVQYPWIIPPDVLHLIDYNILTFHNAKLPEYGGHNAVSHAILNGEREFWATVHWMADEVDRGDLAFETSFRIDPTDTAFSLFGKVHHACLFLFDEVLRRLLAGEPIPGTSQHGSPRVYSRDSIERLREIRGDDEVDAKARAFYFPPFEPAYLLRDGRKHYVLPAAVWSSESSPLRDSRELLNESIARCAEIDFALAR
jgi:methionyl-tRNA formyltransferase